MTSPTDDKLRRSFVYAADADSIAMARRDVTGFVTEQLRPVERVSAEQLSRLIERLGLVVSELCGNAAEAAPGRWFQVAIAIDDVGDGHGGGVPERVTCLVTNPHSGDDPRVLEFGARPDPLARRGRGLLIVDDLADRRWIERTPETTIVGAELTLMSDH